MVSAQTHPAVYRINICHTLQNALGFAKAPDLRLQGILRIDLQPQRALQLGTQPHRAAAVFRHRAHLFRQFRHLARVFPAVPPLLQDP